MGDGASGSTATVAQDPPSLEICSPPAGDPSICLGLHYSPPEVLPIPSAGCGDPDLPTAALCPLCYTGFDDYHYLLVECSHKELCERRQRIICSLQVQAALTFKDLPTAVGAYIDKFLGCLLQPDPSRLSHSIWLMRPFLPTLQAIDATMSHKE